MGEESPKYVSGIERHCQAKQIQGVAYRIMQVEDRNSMTTALPPPGSNDIGDHVAMSHRFIEHARDELSRDNRLQASEKVWGAAAHALKAIAIQRGWRHRAHVNVVDIGEHLAKEFDRDDFNSHVNTADSMHKNFYENDRSAAAILWAINDVEKFVAKLDDVRASSPRPFTVMDNDDRDRLGRLLGLRGNDRPAIGSHSRVGFSQTRGEDT